MLDMRNADHGASRSVSRPKTATDRLQEKWAAKWAAKYLPEDPDEPFTVTILDREGLEKIVRDEEEARKEGKS